MENNPQNIPQNIPQPEESKEETLELLKRGEARTMQRDLAKLREAEAEQEKQRVAALGETKKQAPAANPGILMPQENEPIAKEIPKKEEIIQTLIPAQKPASSFKKILIRLSAIIIVLLLGSFFYWLFSAGKLPKTEITRPETENIAETPVESEEIAEELKIVIPEALISAGFSETIEIADITAIPQMVSQIMQKTYENEGYSRILFQNTKENKIIGLKEFISAFPVTVPEKILAGLENDFTLFVYSSKGTNRLGFVAKTNSDISSEVSLWEKTMEADTQNLFAVLGKKDKALASSFKSSSYQGNAFRFLTISKDDFGICYSLFNNYFIFATSFESLEKTIDAVKIKESQTTSLEKETVSTTSPIFSIVDNIITWGFYTPKTPRLIDTIIIHSAYNNIGGDVYSIDKIIQEFQMYKVASHYLISREGKIYRLVLDEAIAYHAGKGSMPDGSRTNVVNNFSVGIELIYTEEEGPNEIQYQALTYLVKNLQQKFNIPQEKILGHKDTSSTGKTDPWNFDREKFIQTLN